MDMVKLCSINDFDGKDKIKVELEGYKPFAVYQIEGQYFVTSDTCSHGQASLTEDGELDGFEIECGWHEGRFDVRSGNPTASPCVKPIKTYPITVEDSTIYITLKK